jgi:hypothetical protein
VNSLWGKDKNQFRSAPKRMSNTSGTNSGNNSGNNLKDQLLETSLGLLREYLSNSSVVKEVPYLASKSKKHVERIERLDALERLHHLSRTERDAKRRLLQSLKQSEWESAARVCIELHSLQVELASQKNDLGIESDARAQEKQISQSA